VYATLFGDTSVPVIAQIGFYLTRPYGHLWYFYALFGLYLSAPYLGKMLRASSERESRIFLLLWFFFASVLYQVRLLCAPWWDPTTFLGTQLFSGYIGLFVLGGYLRRYRPITTNSSRWLCSLLFVASSSATAILTFSHSMHIGRPDESAYFGYLAPLVVVAAASAFALLTSIKWLPTRVAGLVKVISDCSLGIYCLHVMIISFYIEHLHLQDAMHTTWFKVPILWGAVFGSAAVAVYLIRKIPLLRRVA
jgi:surface polysaccharide O-acyltransferase-like enzyme